DSRRQSRPFFRRQNRGKPKRSRAQRRRNPARVRLNSNLAVMNTSIVTRRINKYKGVPPRCQLSPRGCPGTAGRQSLLRINDARGPFLLVERLLPPHARKNAGLFTSQQKSLLDLLEGENRVGLGRRCVPHEGRDCG